jgi:hypothetical protein
MYYLHELPSNFFVGCMRKMRKYKYEKIFKMNQGGGTLKSLNFNISKLKYI